MGMTGGGTGEVSMGNSTTEQPTTSSSEQATTQSDVANALGVSSSEVRGKRTLLYEEHLCLIHDLHSMCLMIGSNLSTGCRDGQSSSFW